MSDREHNLDEVRHEELWQAVLRTAVDPIIVIDEQGIILRANEATEGLFGYAAEYLVGKNVSLLMPEPYRSEHDDYLKRYLDTGEARIIGIGREVEAQKADGQIFPIALAVSEIKWGERCWFTGIIHDLTNRRAVENELRRAKEQLEDRVRQRTAELEASMTELARSNRDLEQFAYIASHDLQTPLRNVRQGLELLDEHLEQTLGHQLDPEAKELRDLTVSAAGRMEQLIQGLLSYSRLDRSGRPPRDPVDLRDLTEELVQQMAVEFGEADATVELAKLPTVLGDETQLRQLLQNLLENAIKYRQEGRPLEITMSAEPFDDRWLISVGDNGIGIDPRQHDRVFELFRRAHPDYEGMGLGLAICQRIVERHGGDIWVTAGPDGGSTFSFTIPKTDV
ncbi:MAG: sensor histidine kinase [Acidimicrobiales bacterium]